MAQHIQDATHKNYLAARTSARRDYPPGDPRVKFAERTVRQSRKWARLWRQAAARWKRQYGCLR
jgi:hypothetical protein